MLNKIKKSLAYRLPRLYKYILKYKKARTLSKSKTDLSVVMMTGKNHIDLLRLSVLSIANTWRYLPKLIISSDGSLSIDEIRKALSFWKGEMDIQSWKHSSNYHKQKNRRSILKYAAKDPFGKKLAIILHYAEKNPVLWIDSDILFFNDFTGYIPQNTNGFVCGGSEDWIGAYHDILLKKIGNNLYNLTNFNAGLLYVSGDGIYEAFQLEEIIEDIDPLYDFLTEQTIFAHIASKSLGIIWDRNIVKNFNSDNQELKAMPISNTIARHYTSNIRHLFWRDAFFHLKFIR